jgi:mannose-1-phosphate guanylyltransferase
MLDWSLARAERLVSPERVAAVVAASHRRWWSRALAGRGGPRVAVQPRDRGTAVGVLLGLAYILRRDPLARLLVFPADHYVADESVLEASWIEALQAVHEDAERVVLLGMTPEDRDPEYGWIVSTPAGSGNARSVVSFVEQPDTDTAVHLGERGALVNSFMLVAAGAVLRRLYADAQPDLLEAFAPLGDEPAWSPASLASLYEGLPTRDFSRDVLERSAERLLVLPVPPCGWSDLGTPARLSRHLRTHLRPHPGPGPRRRGRPPAVAQAVDGA